MICCVGDQVAGSPPMIPDELLYDITRNPIAIKTKSKRRNVNRSFYIFNY